MWAPDSWQQKSALQQPEYADPAEVERVLADLRTLPPLVTSWEILRLRGLKPRALHAVLLDALIHDMATGDAVRVDLIHQGHRGSLNLGAV